MWVNAETGRVYVRHDEIRAELANTLLPAVIDDATLAEVGVLPVLQVAAPEHDALTHIAVMLGAGLVDNVWVQQWELQELSVEQAQRAREARKTEIVAAAQARLDAFAQTRGYDSMLSLCSYATSTVEHFRAEGEQGVALRDAMWSALAGILAEVEAGTRPIPANLAAIESELPVLEWAQ